MASDFVATAENCFFSCAVVAVASSHPAKEKLERHANRKPTNNCRGKTIRALNVRFIVKKYWHHRSLKEVSIAFEKGEKK